MKVKKQMMPTVLHVEDDKMIATVVRVVLGKMGIDVINAETATEGLKMAREHIPDAILMDIWLPDTMNGWEATEHLKADAALAHIPVVAVTAHGGWDAQKKAEACGCETILTKPFMLDDLQNCVSRLFS